MNVRCPNCRKKTSVAESEAGLLALCPACGAFYRVPPPPEPQPIVPSASMDSAQSPRRRFRWVALLLWVFVGLLLVGTGGAISWAVYTVHVARESQALAHAMELKARTEMLISAGRIPEAMNQYQELENFVSGSPRADFRSLAADVRRELTEKRAAIEKASHAPPVVQAQASTAVASPPHASPPLISVPAASTQPAPQPPSTAPPVQVASSSANPKSPAPANIPHADEGPYPANAGNNRPPIKKVALADDELTDEKIGQAITLGVDELLRHFDPTTHLLRGANDNNSPAKGLDILCVYALMQCQQATNDPRLNPHDPLMKGLIDAMKRLNLSNYHFETYSRGLRSTALALYNRTEDREALGADAAALVRGSHGGGYTYQLAHAGLVRDDREDHWDNSNSQYGLLGVWSAAEVAIEVPESYWALVQKHWVTAQCRDGEWDYRDGGSSGTHSMTCAGLASLFVTHDYLDNPRFGAEVGRDPFTPPIARGLAWLERGDNSVRLNHGAYDLYGLERVGLASGFKYFGNHDWYRQLAAQTIAGQHATGGWGGDVETAYSLLFLSRGRHPILMNKLRFDGYWANRPRDVANLARFVGYQLERPLNWQVVPITRQWTDWMDSPILYLSSHKPPRLSDSEYDKIRSFVENGGMLFMQADGGSVEFGRFAHEAAHKLFPTYEMTPLPATHPLCSVLYKIKPDGNIFVVSNGSRILMLYAAEDLSRFWQQRDSKNRPFPFQLGANLFIYAGGKRDLRNRLSSSYIPPVQATPVATYRLARLKYAGNWDPEPAAWPRFSRWFHLNTGYALEIVQAPIAELKPETAPIAELTGNAPYDLTQAESAALRKYVDAGGVVLVDLCGGTGTFDKSVQSSLFKTFPNASRHVLPSSHPMLKASADGMEDLSKPLLRQFAMDTLGAGGGLPESIASGKGHVILTSLDITSGLLGTGTWGIAGYEPKYAQSLVKNVVLWTIDGQHDQAPVANR